jgi:hypothetical protein
LLWYAGSKAVQGFSIDEVRRFQVDFEHAGFACEMVWLNEALQDSKTKDGQAIDTSMAAAACVLVIRGGAARFVDVDALFHEQHGLKKDTKAFMKGEVKNKRARHNLCFNDVGHEAKYEEGKGTVVGIPDIVHAIRTCTMAYVWCGVLVL